MTRQASFLGRCSQRNPRPARVSATRIESQKRCVFSESRSCVRRRTDCSPAPSAAARDLLKRSAAARVPSTSYRVRHLLPRERFALIPHRPTRHPVPHSTMRAACRVPGPLLVPPALGLATFQGRQPGPVRLPRARRRLFGSFSTGLGVDQGRIKF